MQEDSGCWASGDLRVSMLGFVLERRRILALLRRCHQQQRMRVLPVLQHFVRISGRSLGARTVALSLLRFWHDAGRHS